MTELSILQRKAGRLPAKNEPEPISADRVWRRAVTHGLARSIDLEAEVTTLETTRCLPAALVEEIDENALCLLLDGPPGYGAAILDTALVTAIIEAQTMGVVQKRSVQDRPATAIDAAMTADSLDRVLAAQEALAEELQPGIMVSGYRYATRVTDPRDLTLSLDEATFDKVRLTIALGGAVREGTLTLVLPQPGPVVAPTPAEDEAPSPWHAALETRLMGSEMLLRAELARLRLPIADVTGWAEGAILTLDRAAISKVRLMAGGGAQIGTARLGQSAGRKALRLDQAPDPAPSFAPASWPQVLQIESKQDPSGKTG